MERLTGNSSNHSTGGTSVSHLHSSEEAAGGGDSQNVQNPEIDHFAEPFGSSNSTPSDHTFHPISTDTGLQVCIIK